VCLSLTKKGGNWEIKDNFASFLLPKMEVSCFCFFVYINSLSSFHPQNLNSVTKTEPTTYNLMSSPCAKLCNSDPLPYTPLSYKGVRTQYSLIKRHSDFSRSKMDFKESIKEHCISMDSSRSLRTLCILIGSSVTNLLHTGRVQHGDFLKLESFSRKRTLSPGENPHTVGWLRKSGFFDT